MEELKKPYNPTEHEDAIYKSGKNPDFLIQMFVLRKALLKKMLRPFTIIMPPTNANGNLHAGHGLVMTIEDIMVRYNRMAGKNFMATRK